MSKFDRSQLERLEIFSRSVATLHTAGVKVDVEALAETYEIDWPSAKEEGADEHEPTDKELADAHRARTGASS